MKQGNWNSAGREGPESPSRATNRPKTSAAALKKRLSAIGPRLSASCSRRGFVAGERAASQAYPSTRLETLQFLVPVTNQPSRNNPAPTCKTPANERLLSDTRPGASTLLGWEPPKEA
jgi:hypothetical protein